MPNRNKKINRLACPLHPSTPPPPPLSHSGHTKNKSKIGGEHTSHIHPYMGIATYAATTTPKNSTIILIFGYCEFQWILCIGNISFISYSRRALLLPNLSILNPLFSLYMHILISFPFPKYTYTIRGHLSSFIHHLCAFPVHSRCILISFAYA